MNITQISDFSSQTISDVLAKAHDEIVFVTSPGVHVDPSDRMFDRMRQVMEDSGAGIVYSNAAGHPRIDYQFGSIRDNFDFGPVVAVSVSAARKVGRSGDYRWGGFYDL